MVAKGLAVEVEDRGLGMSEEDYDSFNAQLAEPPQFDVVALADDLRLGMFVIARLAQRHGIAVTLRSSPFGGTTAIVLIPHDVVVRDLPAPEPDEVEHSGAAEPEEPVRESRPVVPARTATAQPSSPDSASATRREGGLTALPRRVPQTSLAAELREETRPAEAEENGYDDFTAERAASSLACFQRGTLQARDEGGDETADPPEAAADQRIPAARRTLDDVAPEEPPAADGADADAASSPTSSSSPADRS